MASEMIEKGRQRTSQACGIADFGARRFCQPLPDFCLMQMENKIIGPQARNIAIGVEPFDEQSRALASDRHDESRGKLVSSNVAVENLGRQGDLLARRRKLEEGAAQACLETVRGHGYRLRATPHHA